MPTSLLSLDELPLLNTTLSAELLPGELIAVIGPNRSGKTTLGRMLAGEMRQVEKFITRHLPKSAIAFSDHTADSRTFHYADFYYQQRYNASDVAKLETIGERLGHDETDAYQRNLLATVLPAELLAKKMIELSSGETRKVLLLQSLQRPAVLYILDSPFTGLDQASIHQFRELFQRLCREYGKTILLLLTDNQFDLSFDRTIELAPAGQGTAGVRPLPNDAPFFHCPPTNFTTVFQIQNADLIAGPKTLLHQCSWTINQGDKWLLRGPNGAGKSTLMSLLNADNPRAYALGIRLFDRRRGTGESIWDIKARIGFVSSEIQLFWNTSQRVQQIVLSGFTDTLYLNRKIRPAEWAAYRHIMDLLGLTSREQAAFGELSSSERKLVMVARALVKNPPVLILDEPFQGLDEAGFQFLYGLLSRCADEERTVIQIAHLEREILPGMERVAVIEGGRLVFRGG